MDYKTPKIVAFYDSETTNIGSITQGFQAFPILHQLGIINRSDIALKDITTKNVEDVIAIKLYRHTHEVCAALDLIPQLFSNENIIPIVVVQNLGFDMFGLSDWLNTKEVKVLAKSSRKPISFQLLDENGEPYLIIWDSQQFSGKSLLRMGQDCGYPKLQGSWDYDLIRTPDTPLTEKEIAYAKHDIYTLAAWFGFWCRNNPDIEENKLGVNVCTKTGIVREKRKILFSNIKGKGNRYNVSSFWLFQNRKEQPKSDDELFTMQACTRGGFTFCSNNSASVVYDLKNNEYILGYDATSMHPSCMVSHAYPENFKPAGIEELKLAASIIKHTTKDWILKRWYNPFPVAFNACFEFTNIRVKPNTVFAENGIYPLAWARMNELKTEVNLNNEAQSLFLEKINELGYRDYAINPSYSFGKLNSADKCTLYLTELAFWEVCQCYDFDSVEPLHGYLTGRFCKPTDMSILSVMHFYNAKKVLKNAVIEYEQKGHITNKDELARFTPEWLANGAAAGTISLDDLKLELLSSKQSLNGLFGVECTNEFRDDTILTSAGISYKGELGLINAPKNPKSWYQFGQRIVGWSRIMQNIAIQLVAPYCKAIICGDTDSIKLYSTENNIKFIDKELEKIATAIDKGKAICTSRVKNKYPDYYDELKGIGYYMLEFKAQQFCASWNKAYLIKNEDNYEFTLAGITTNRRYIGADDEIFNNSYNDLALYLEKNKGYSFADICNLLLGYNIQIDSSITKINGRKAPEWGSSVFMRVKDYLGKETLVAEPAAEALFNMPKLIGGVDSKENAINLSIAKENNNCVNSKYIVLQWYKDCEPDIIYL